MSATPQPAFLSAQAVTPSAKPSLLSNAMEALLHASPDPIFIVDRQGRYLAVGEAGAKALGLPASEIVGKALHEFGLEPEVAADLAAQTEQVFRTKQSVTGESLIPTLSGLSLYKHTFSPLLDDQGEVVAMLCIAKDATDRHLETEQALHEDEIADFERDAEGAVRQLIGTAIDITDRKQAEERAEILSQVSDAVGMIDNNERILYLNPAGEHLYRVKAADVLGRKLSALYQRRWLKPEDEAAANATLRERGEAVWELIHVTHDGRELHVQSNVCLMRDAAGNVTGIIAAIRDISERKQAEAELARKLNEIEALYDAMPIGLVLFDRDLRFLRVNKALADMNGLPAADHIGKLAWHIVPALRGSVEPNLLRVLTTGETFEAEIAGETPKYPGAMHYWHVRYYPLKDKDGVVVAVGSTVADITESKYAEEALHASQEQLRVAIAAARLGQWSLDLQTSEMTCSEGCKANFGRRPDDRFTYDDLWAMIHPDDRDRVRAAVKRAVEDRTDYDTEYQTVWPDGTLHWVIVRGLVQQAPDGTPLVMTGVTLDITDRKRAEEAVARLAAIVQSSHDALFSEDLDGIITSWNPGAEQIFGYHAEEILGASIMRLMPADRQAAEHELQRQIVAGELGGTFEAIRLTREGREFPASITIAPMKDAAGKVIGTSRVLRDITERKRREGNLTFLADLQADFVALLTTDEILRIAGERIATYFNLTNCSFVEINEAMDTAHIVHDQHAADAVDLTGVYAIEDFHSAEERAEILAGRAIVINDTGAMREPEAAARFDALGIRALVTAPYVSHGRWRFALCAMCTEPRVWLEAEVELLTEIAARLYVRFERARADEQLRQSEERFRAAVGVVSSFIWTNNASGEMEGEQPGWAKFTGQSQEEYQGYGWASAVHPEDAQMTIDGWNQAVAEKRMFEVEHRVRRHDGEWRLCDVRAAPVLDEKGEIREWVGVHTDITERILAEERLRRSEERFRTAEKASRSFVYDYYPETGQEERSEGFTGLLGYNNSELPYGGSVWETLIHSEDLEKVRLATEEAKNGLSPFASVEYRLRHKAGHWVWVMDEFMAIRNDEGTLQHIIGSILDISVLKNQQQEITELNTRLQRAMAETHHRVKNNLQMLSALVSLHLQNKEETVPVSALHRINRHIHTLGSLHDMLTLGSKATTGQDTVSLKATLEKLVPLLQTTAGAREIRVQADEMQATLKQGSSFALLVNELVTNALKHGREAVDVTLRVAPRFEPGDALVKTGSLSARLEVCDDGAGFPADFNAKTASNMGLDLVKSLGEWDLKGVISYENRSEGGARVTVTFPISEDIS